VNAELPPNDRITGKGLNQRLSIERMEEHFAAVLHEPPHRIALDGLVTDHLRVECDREHPVWPNHGECNGGPFNVPFGVLHPLKAYGQPLAATPEPGILPALEAEAWRFTWNMQAGIAGTMAEPLLRAGRNGCVGLPLFFVGSGNGCLRCGLLDGAPDSLHVQAESYQRHACQTAGLALAPFPESDQPVVVPAGTRTATLELSLASLEPDHAPGEAELSPGLRTCWASVFTSFRPEFGGFSTCCPRSPLGPHPRSRRIPTAACAPASTPTTSEPCPSAA
jgi:hypothetical protein